MPSSTIPLQATRLSLRNILQITKALADEQRVRALMLLEDGELCVCQLIEVLGLAPSTVSRHLSILHTAGLVKCRKEGRWAYYRLVDGQERGAAQPLLDWLRNSLAGDQTVHSDRAKLAAVLQSGRGKLCLRQA